MSAAELPDGFEVGHWSDPEAMTGCTVILAPPGSRGGVCVQGGGPGTRETDALDPGANSEQATAVLFAGGSAFGLAAADGVVRWCEQNERGYATPSGLVPIVPAAVIYDLASGRPDVRPGPEDGYAACEAAGAELERGAVGAGTGAMVGKLMGRERGSRGGVGVASLETGTGAAVGVIVVVNAVGDVIGEDGGVLAGIQAAEGEGEAPRSAEAMLALGEMPTLAPKRNSTLACVCTDAALDKRECSIVARMAVAGMARAIDPVFTPFDGDVAFCLASGAVQTGGHSDPRGFEIAQIGVAAASATAAAIREAVR